MCFFFSITASAAKVIEVIPRDSIEFSVKDKIVFTKGAASSNKKAPKNQTDLFFRLYF